MKLQDKETLNVADAVKDVLEGKIKEKMDPRLHVKEKDGMYCVVDANGKEVKKFKSKADAEKYAIDNHDKLMAVKKESPEEPNKPSGRLGPQTGERDFKGKHAVKKSGMRDDGTNMKEAAEDLEEKKVEEVSDKQKKYQKVFQAALKKFGVKSPGELEGDKKKEFFDYVDAQYDAGENEAD